MTEGRGGKGLIFERLFLLLFFSPRFFISPAAIISDIFSPEFCCRVFFF